MINNSNNSDVLNKSDNKSANTAFLVIAVFLVVYVAFCTGQRENGWSWDAWEHQRSIRALVENFWDPGNPTYPLSTPSVRYSPYIVTLAAICKALHINTYDVLSYAAIFNTILLILAVKVFLNTHGEGKSAAAVLFIMVTLWAGPPGHSNSFALADLPVQQVNPSAFALPLSLFLWTLFYRFKRLGWKDWGWVVMLLISACMLLDHVITLAFTHIALWTFALSDRNKRSVAMLLAITVGASILGFTWPWFDLLHLITKGVTAGLINEYVIYLILFSWVIPALIGGLISLQLQKNYLVSILVKAGITIYLINLITYITPFQFSGFGAISRMALPGALCFHMALGIFATHNEFFSISKWRERVSILAIKRNSNKISQTILDFILLFGLFYFTLPQIKLILKEPFLAREYIATALGKENKQIHLWKRAQKLMEPVGRADVVLSDTLTSWSVVAASGRIVYGLHPEAFVKGQTSRKIDVEHFFSTDSNQANRLEIIKKYNVKWFVLNKHSLDSEVFDELYDKKACIYNDDIFYLINVEKWIK
ncbi:MAG: hypothetical protein V3U87_09520 [Methylococcaceae bacterium]